MEWEEVLPKIEIRGFTPETASSDKVRRKNELYDRLKEEIDDLPRIRELTKYRHLAIDVCYYLEVSSGSGKSKKDLDNLLKILFDVLSENMRNGQDPLPGLDLMPDDTFVYKIKCEKKENYKGIEGFDLRILRQV